MRIQDVMRLSYYHRLSVNFITEIQKESEEWKMKNENYQSLRDARLQVLVATANVIGKSSGWCLSHFQTALIWINSNQWLPMLAQKSLCYLCRMKKHEENY